MRNGSVHYAANAVAVNIEHCVAGNIVGVEEGTFSRVYVSEANIHDLGRGKFWVCGEPLGWGGWDGMGWVGVSYCANLFSVYVYFVYFFLFLFLFLPLNPLFC